MRRFAPLILILLLFGMLGCGEKAVAPTAAPAESAEATPTPATVTEAPAEPADSRPEEVRVIAPRNEDRYAEVYESLYLLSEDKLMPLLAEDEAEHEAGSASYTISLCSDICDSEGNALSIADAAASYLAFAEKTGDKLLASAEETEDGKLLLRFERPLSEREERCWLCSVPLYHSEGSGTGPYKIAEESESELLLIPNEGYWGHAEGKQNVRIIRYLFINSASAQVIALETGKADMALGISYEDAVDFLPGGSYSDLFKALDSYSSAARFLLPNVGKGSKLEDEQLRLALFSSIDAAALADALGGRACSALGNPDSVSFAGDSYQSKHTAVENSTLSKLTLTLLCAESGESRIAAQQLSRQWEALGVTVRLVSSEEESWDLAIVETQSCPSVVQQWAELWNYSDGAKLLRGGLEDASLLNLLESLQKPKTDTSELMEKLQERVYAHGLAYALPQLNEPIIVPSALKQVGFNGQVLLPGSCLYE